MSMSSDVMKVIATEDGFSDGYFFDENKNPFSEGEMMVCYNSGYEKGIIKFNLDTNGVLV